MSGSLHYIPTKVLIWGKTYPELSTRHLETVCTGGCLEDGRPVRLYPVDFRYLTGDGQYRLYNWIEVPIARSPRDRRPESFKVRADQIRILSKVGTADSWAERRATIFKDPSWHFDCLDQLKRQQELTRQSLGLIRVGRVDQVRVVRRPAEDRRKHDAKLASLKIKGDLFGVKAKDLAFLPFQISIAWHCRAGSCKGHSASILDWGLLELGRKLGDAAKAQRKMELLADLERHDLHLYMGNMARRRHVFSCIGLWYPVRAADSGQATLALD